MVQRYEQKRRLQWYKRGAAYQSIVIRQVEIQAEILLDGWHQLKLAVALHHQLGLLGIKKVEGSIAAFCLTPTMPSRS